MKKITLLIIILISLTSGYDKYLKEGKVYLCKKIETENDYGFESYIIDLFKDSLDGYIDFVDYHGANDKELVTYNQSYHWGKKHRKEPPKFAHNFPADYYIVLKVKIDSTYATNEATTFNISDATFKKISYGSFTIGGGDEKYHQYYVSIDASIYTVVRGVLYYHMVNENDSHEEEDVFNEEIKYNIDECIEDFPDMFNDAGKWREYKNRNKELASGWNDL